MQEFTSISNHIRYTLTICIAVATLVVVVANILSLLKMVKIDNDPISVENNYKSYQVNNYLLKIEN